MSVASAAPFLAAALLAVTPSAEAACSPVELRAFDRSMRNTFSCATRVLRSGGTCDAGSPPDCAAQAAADLTELLGGLPTAATEHRQQARCQIAVYRAARKFLKKRVRERLRGRRAQDRSNRSLLFLNRRCSIAAAQSPDGDPVPDFGGSCFEQSTVTGSFIDATRLRQCLRPRLEGIATSLLDAEPIAPNVVLIVTDDQHPAAIESMPRALAEIVGRGVSFPTSFTTTPVCAPSRAGILTGLHATGHGVLTNLGEGELGGGASDLDSSSTLATWLQAAGYRTALFGKYLNGYGELSPAVPPGWDDWRVFVGDPSNYFDYLLNENGVVRAYGHDSQEYSTDVIAGLASQFIEENRETPFFVMFAPFAPHSPYVPAPRHDGLLADSPPWRPASWNEDLADKPDWLRWWARTTEALLDFDDDVQRQRESLIAVDEAIGAILDQLEDQGLADNTIVLLTSDHGTLWGEHRWIGKMVVYEESIRVPLAVRYPVALPSGTVVPGLASTLDIAPTIAALAGVEPGHAVDGRPLTDLLDGAPDWRTDLLIQRFSSFLYPPWDALRTERYVYVRNDGGDDLDELYDLQTDPYQLDNRAADPAYADVRNALATRLDELL